MRVPDVNGPWWLTAAALVGGRSGLGSWAKRLIRRPAFGELSTRPQWGNADEFDRVTFRRLSGETPSTAERAFIAVDSAKLCPRYRTEPRSARPHPL
jgi:hypothetical protein